MRTYQKPTAKLIAATKSFIVINPEENQAQPVTIGEILAYVARVSNPGNQLNNQTAPKLLSYCLNHGHWSVFETCSLTVEITTSRAIAQQILRHWSLHFQEFSQRYAEAVSYEPAEARRQAKKNRQDSIDDLPESDKAWFNEAQEKVWELGFGLYQESIRRGIALECARFLLPLATTTTIYITGTIRSLIHYCLSRCPKGVQKEHRDIAWAVLDVLLKEVPELAAYMAEKLDCDKLYKMSNQLEIVPHSWGQLVNILTGGGYDLYFSEFPESQPFQIVKWSIGNPGENEPYKQNICIEDWDDPGHLVAVAKGKAIPVNGCYGPESVKCFKLRGRPNG